MGGSTSQSSMILGKAIELAATVAEPQLEQLRQLLPGIELTATYTARIPEAHKSTFIGFAKDCSSVHLDKTPMVATMHSGSIALRAEYTGPLSAEEVSEIENAVIGRLRKVLQARSVTGPTI